MFKIQNLACLPITITPDDNIIQIKSDILKGKKINAIYLLSVYWGGTIYSPYNAVSISNINELSNLNLYLNASDLRGKKIIQDLNIRNIIIEYGPLINKFLEFRIDSVLNTDNLFINSKSVISTTASLLALVFYQNSHFSPIQDEVNGSVTIPFNIVNCYSDIKLSTCVNELLAGRKINRILLTNTNTPAYLDLISKDKKRYIQNVPLNLFSSDLSPKTFLIDPIEIDFENSYLRYRGGDEGLPDGINVPATPVNITFMY